MTNKKKIVLTILSCVFIAIACIFGFSIANKQDLNVKADTVVHDNQFFGSGIFSPISTFQGQTYDSSLGYTYTCYFIPTTLKAGLRYSNAEHWSFSMDMYFSRDGGVAIPNNANIHISLVDYQLLYDEWNVTPLDNGQGIRWYILSTYCESGFNFNVRYVHIHYDSSVAGRSNLICTHIDLVDSNNKHLNILLPYDSFATYDSTFYFVDRTYLIGGDTLTDNEYYNLGKDDGIIVGKQEGFDEGYQRSILENKSIWEQAGYNRGIQDANDYTFLGLIGATIDAPISALFGHIDTDSSSPTYNQRVGGFFNFELLGVNLKDFFFAVLTFAVVIVIVRFAIGK